MRYHPALVLLHWFLAFVVILALIMGSDIATLDNDLSLKVDRLFVHRAAGLIIFLLFIIRVFVKLLTKTLSSIDSGSKVQNKLAKTTHSLLYGLIFAVVLTGIATAQTIGLAQIIATEGELPNNLNELLPRIAHGIFTTILMITIALHFLAALFHQFILKDQLFSRMWLGKE